MYVAMEIYTLLTMYSAFCPAISESDQSLQYHRVTLYLHVQRVTNLQILKKKKINYWLLLSSRATPLPIPYFLNEPNVNPIYQSTAICVCKVLVQSQLFLQPRDSYAAEDIRST